MYIDFFISKDDIFSMNPKTPNYYHTHTFSHSSLILNTQIGESKCQHYYDIQMIVLSKNHTYSICMKSSY